MNKITIQPYVLELDKKIKNDNKYLSCTNVFMFEKLNCSVIVLLILNYSCL